MQISTPLPERAVPASLNVQSTLTDSHGALRLGNGDKIQLDYPDHSVESRHYSWDRAEQLVRSSDLGRPSLSRGA